MDPISVATVLRVFVLAIFTTSARNVVELVKTTTDKIVYRKENKLKKLIARKDELVKRDIECERLKEIRKNENDWNGKRNKNNLEKTCENENDWNSQINKKSEVENDYNDYCDKARK